MAGKGSVKDSEKLRDAAATAALSRFEQEEARKREAKAKHEKAKADAKQAEEDELMAMKTAAAAAAEVLDMKQEVKSAQAKEAARLAAEERDRVARESGMLRKTEESVSERSNMATREYGDDEIRSLKAAIGRAEEARRAARKAEEERLEDMKREAAAAAEALEMKQTVKSAQAKEAARLAAEEREIVSSKSRMLKETASETNNSLSMMARADSYEDEVKSSLRKAKERGQQGREASKKAEEEILDVMKREAAAQSEAMERRESTKSSEAREAARLAAERRARRAGSHGMQTFTPSSLSYWEEVRDREMRKEKESKGYKDLGNVKHRDMMQSLAPTVASWNVADKRIEIVDVTGNQKESVDEGNVHDRTPKYSSYKVELRGGKFGDKSMQDLVEEYFAKDKVGARPKERSVEQLRYEERRKAGQGYSEAVNEERRKSSELDKDVVSVGQRSGSGYTVSGKDEKPDSRVDSYELDEDRQRYKSGEKKTIIAEQIGMSRKLRWIKDDDKMNQGVESSDEKTCDLDEERKRYRSEEKKTIATEQMGIGKKLKWLKDEKMNQGMESSNAGKIYDLDEERQRYRSEESEECCKLRWHKDNDDKINERVESSNIKTYDSDEERQRYRSEEKKSISVAELIEYSGKLRWLKDDDDKVNERVESSNEKTYDSDEERQRYSDEKKSISVAEYIGSDEKLRWLKDEVNQRVESSNDKTYDLDEERRRYRSEEKEIVSLTNLSRREGDLNKLRDDKRTLENEDLKTVKNERDMGNRLLICGGCNQKYNFKGKLPRELYCKHSICTPCIRARTNPDKSVTCPHCPHETYNVHDPHRCPINEELLEKMHEDTQHEVCEGKEEKVVCSGGAEMQLPPDYGHDSRTLTSQREAHNGRRDYFVRSYGSGNRKESKAKFQGISQHQEPVKSPHSSKCFEMGVRPAYFCSTCHLWLCSKCAQIDHNSIKCDLKPMIEQLDRLKRKYDLVNQRTQAMLEKSIATLEDEKKADMTLLTWMELIFDGQKERRERTNDAMMEGRNLMGTLDDVVNSMKHSSNLAEAVTSFEILDALETEAKNWSLRVDIDATDGEEMSVCIKYLLKWTIKSFVGKDGTLTLYAANKITGAKLFSQVMVDGGRYYLPALSLNKPRNGAHILLVQCFISSQNPSSTSVYLDLSWENRCRGRVFIRLTGDTLRGRQFISLCTGEGGTSLRGTPFHRVWWKGLPGEHVWTGDIERGDGSGGRTPYDSSTKQSDLASSREVPISAGLVAGRYEKNLSSIFRIYTRDSKDGKDEEGFGQVEFGLDVVRSAIMVKDISEVVISDCGLVLEM